MVPSQDYSQGEGRSQDEDRTDFMQVVGMGENCKVTVSDWNQFNMEQASSRARGTLNPDRGARGSNSPGTNEQESSGPGIYNITDNMQVVGMGNYCEVQIGYNPTPPYIPPILQGYNPGYQHPNQTPPPFSRMPPRSQEYYPGEHYYKHLKPPPFGSTPSYPQNWWGSSEGHRQQTQIPDVLPPPNQYGADAHYVSPPAAPNPRTPASRDVANVQVSVPVAATRMPEQAPSAIPCSESFVASTVTEVVETYLPVAGPTTSKAVTPSSAPPITSQAEDFGSPSSSNVLSTPVVESALELPHPTATNHDPSRLLVQHPQPNTTENGVSEITAPSCTLNVTPSLTEHLNKDVSPGIEETLSAIGVPELPDNEVAQHKTKKFCPLVSWIINKFKKRPRHV